MKIYLIMLAISFVSMVVVNLEMIGYEKSHYRVLYKPNIYSCISGYIKIIIFTLLIIPYTLNLILSIFFNDAFLKGVDKALSENERFEAI